MQGQSANLVGVVLAGGVVVWLALLLRRRGGRHCRRGRTGQRFGVAPVVGESHRDRDGPARVGAGQGVRGLGGADDGRAVGLPLVGEDNDAHPVGVGDTRDVRRERLAYLRRAADAGLTRGRTVGQRQLLLLGLLLGVQNRLVLLLALLIGSLNRLAFLLVGLLAGAVSAAVGCQPLVNLAVGLLGHVLGQEL